MQDLTLKIKTFRVRCAAERAKVRKFGGGGGMWCRPTLRLCVEIFFTQIFIGLPLLIIILPLLIRYFNSLLICYDVSDKI